MFATHVERKTEPTKKRGKTAAARRAPARSSRRTSATEGADAVLINLCREFGALEQRILITTLSIDSARARDRITTPLYLRQDMLLERIRAIQPQTLAGCKALAATLHLVTRFIDKSGSNWDLMTMLLGGLEKLKA